MTKGISPVSWGPFTGTGAGGTFNSWEASGVPPAPILNETFEESSLSTNLTALGFIRTTGVVDNTHAIGNLSAKHSIALGSDGDQSFGCARALPADLVEGEEFWIEAQFYYPETWDFGNNGDAGLGGAAPRTKNFRLHTKTSGGANAGYNDLYLWKEDATQTRWNWIKEQQDFWAFDGLDGFAPGRPQAPYTAITRGQWSSVQYYVKLHSDPSQAIVRVWVDGLLEVEITDLATLNTSTDVANEWQFCTYYNGGAPATQDMWSDNWLVYTSSSPPVGLDASGNVFIGVV